MRPLTPTEVSVVRWFADRVDPTLKQSLLDDLDRASAEEIRDEQLMIRFEIEGYTRPTSPVSVPVDATMLDADGAELAVVLSADADGRLYTLEVLRFETGPVIAPNWASLRRRFAGEVLRLNEPDEPVIIEPKRWLRKLLRK